MSILFGSLVSLSRFFKSTLINEWRHRPKSANHLLENEEWAVSVNQCCTLLFQVFVLWVTIIFSIDLKTVFFGAYMECLFLKTLQKELGEGFSRLHSACWEMELELKFRFSDCRVPVQFPFSLLVTYRMLLSPRWCLTLRYEKCSAGLWLFIYSNTVLIL